MHLHWPTITCLLYRAGVFNILKVVQYIEGGTYCEEEEATLCSTAQPIIWLTSFLCSCNYNLEFPSSSHQTITITFHIKTSSRHTTSQPIQSRSTCSPTSFRAFNLLKFALKPEEMKSLNSTQTVARNKYFTYLLTITLL